MALRYGDSEFATVRPASVSGQAAIGAFRLVLQFEFQLRARAKESRLAFTPGGGDLHGASKNGGAIYLGRLVAQGTPFPRQTYEYADTHTTALEILLSPRQVEHLERVRGGSDLVFSGFIWVNCVGSAEPSVAQESFSYRVPQSEWLEVLRAMGYSRTLLFEVPDPTEQVVPQLSEAVKQFGKAHEAMLRGEWRGSVALCRDVIEALSMGLADSDADDPVFAPLFKNQREMDKPTRIKLLRRAIKLLTHPAKHVDEVSVRFEWTRQDAIAVLGLVSSMLGHSLATSSEK